ncbi:hypothetical protein [Haloplanus natans]|uniref:hypothetical protein n=1 Tax=Haloplanus natans TaxID=376171 RepID=UPI0006782F6F|nr:hypothetical protein [Haloplanus natans]
MSTALLGLLPELLELLLFGVGSVGLSVAGIYIEQFALATIESGNVKLGAWMGFMGAMAFYFAYLMSTDKFRPKLAAVRRQLAD